MVLHETLNPSFAHLKGGEDLFYLISADFKEDVFEFGECVRQAIEQSETYFDLDKLAGRDDLVFISPLPWISFSGVDHTLSLHREDAIPRITWGKYFPQHDRTLLPFNIQVNHMFVDGFHVGRFFEELDSELSSIKRTQRPLS